MRACGMLNCPCFMNACVLSGLQMSYMADLMSAQLHCKGKHYMTVSNVTLICLQLSHNSVNRPSFECM